jgi:hypothetical protein
MPHPQQVSQSGVSSLLWTNFPFPPLMHLLAIELRQSSIARNRVQLDVELPQQLQKKRKHCLVSLSLVATCVKTKVTVHTSKQA